MKLERIISIKKTNKMISNTNPMMHNRGILSLHKLKKITSIFLIEQILNPETSIRLRSLSIIQFIKTERIIKRTKNLIDNTNYNSVGADRKEKQNLIYKFNKVHTAVPSQV